MKFSELITKLHSASQPHMLMYIDIRSDCELADVNILASGQSDVQAGTLYFADAGQLTPDTVLPTNLLYYGTLPPELADRLTNSAMIDRGEFAVLFQTVKELLSYQLIIHKNSTGRLIEVRQNASLHVLKSFRFRHSNYRRRYRRKLDSPL